MVDNANKPIEEVGVRLVGVELVELHTTPKSDFNFSNHEFAFKTEIECKLNKEKKWAMVTVGIDLQDNVSKRQLAQLKNMCVFEVQGFDSVIHLDADGRFNVDESLMALFNTVAYATTRGVMYSEFRGTYLHNAFLPLIPQNIISGKESSGEKSDS